MTASTDLGLRSVGESLRDILEGVLANPELQLSLDDDTRLLGAIAELDSMGAVAIIVGIEDTYGISIQEEKLNADVFATFGSLRRFVESKLSQHGSIATN